MRVVGRHCGPNPILRSQVTLCSALHFCLVLIKDHPCFPFPQPNTRDLVRLSPRVFKVVVAGDNCTARYQVPIVGPDKTKCELRSFEMFVGFLSSHSQSRCGGAAGYRRQETIIIFIIYKHLGCSRYNFLRRTNTWLNFDYMLTYFGVF